MTGLPVMGRGQSECGTRRYGSIYVGAPRHWVTIPLGTPDNPLTDEELAEAKRLIAGKKLDSRDGG